MAVHFVDAFERLSGWNAWWQTSESWSSVGPKDVSNRLRDANSGASEVITAQDAPSSSSVFVAASVNTGSAVDGVSGGAAGYSSQSDSSLAFDSGMASSNVASVTTESASPVDELILVASFVASCAETVFSGALESANQIAGAKSDNGGDALDTATASQASKSLATDPCTAVDSATAVFSAVAIADSQANPVDSIVASAETNGSDVAGASAVDLSSSVATRFVAIVSWATPSDTSSSKADHSAIHFESIPLALDGLSGVVSFNGLIAEATNALSNEAALSVNVAALTESAGAGDAISAVMFALASIASDLAASDVALGRTNVFGNAQSSLSAIDDQSGLASSFAEGSDLLEPADATTGRTLSSATSRESVASNDVQSAISNLNGVAKEVSRASDSESASAILYALQTDAATGKDVVVGRLVLTAGDASFAVADSDASGRSALSARSSEQITAADTVFAKAFAVASTDEVSKALEEARGIASCAAIVEATNAAGDVVRYIEVAAGDNGRLIVALFDTRRFAGETASRDVTKAVNLRKFKKTTTGRGFLS